MMLNSIRKLKTVVGLHTLLFVLAFGGGQGMGKERDFSKVMETPCQAIETVTGLTLSTSPDELFGIFPSLILPRATLSYDILLIARTSQ